VRRIRVIPILLVQNGGLMKTEKFRAPRYVGDPINAVRIFNEKEVDELIVLDTSATPENRPPNMQLVGDLAGECFMPFGYGGGIRTIDQIKAILRAGAEKVSINTAAPDHPELIREASRTFGSQSIVAAIDVKSKLFGKYEVLTKGGSHRTGLDPVTHAKEMEKAGAGEILINSIDRDGTQKGYDEELIRQVSHAVTVPVIACGGAGSVEDFKKAVDAGASAVAAGSMFVFHGPHRAVLITFPASETLRGIFV
jgi:imidazole glycerol-phosphate synthase subunit HisF